MEDMSDDNYGSKSSIILLYEAILKKIVLQSPSTSHIGY